MNSRQFPNCSRTDTFAVHANTKLFNVLRVAWLFIRFQELPTTAFTFIALNIVTVAVALQLVRTAIWALHTS